MFQEFKKTLVFSLPMILGNLSHMLYGVIDSLMVGHLGAVPLAASAFINTVMSFPTIFVIGLSSGISVLVAQSHGRKSYDDCGVYLNNSFWSFLGVGLAIAALFIWRQDDLRLFNQPPEVLAAGRDYFLWMSFSLPFFTLMCCFRKYAEGLSRTLEPLLFFSTGIVFNIFFNWLFIFGRWGFPEMGLAGAGVGTVISRSLMALGFGYYLFRSPKYKDFRDTLHLKYLSRHHFKNLVNIGLPSGFQHLFEVGAFGAGAILMGWFGAYELAAHQIAINVAATAFMVPLGISFGLTVRMGRAFGENNYEAIRTIGLGGVLYSGAIMLFMTAIILGTRHWLPTIYIDEPKVISWAALFLLVAALFQFVDGIQAVLIGILRGLSDVKWPTLITLFSYWGFGLPACYYLGFHTEQGPLGIWIGLGLCLLCAAVLLFSRFTFQLKKLGNWPTRI